MTKKEPASGPVFRAGLAYLGDASGEPHIDGVPARDLTEADLERIPLSADQLIQSGIYAPVEQEQES